MLDDALAAVAPIVADVRERGDLALLEWTERFDGERNHGIRVDSGRIARAAVEDDVLESLRRMIAAVRAFNEAQRPADTSVEAAPGIVSERRWVPLDAVGLCVPSGRVPLPSSLVMTAVPARVAGVRRLVVVTPNPAQATLVVARAEEYAPEHLELHVADPDALVPRIRNAGSVFVGCSSVVGDYAAGATHVLPTGGLARSTGGLGVEAFLKPVQVVTATPEGARRAAEVIVPLARAEGLPLHAAAAA